MQLCPHLCFGGSCRAAFELYERALGGRIDLMLSYGDSPMGQDVPPDWKGKIVHASLTLGDKTLTGADVLPEQYKTPQGFYVLLGVADRAQAGRMFAALAEGGLVHLPMQTTFWSPGFGVVTDRFGIPWEISCEAPPA